MHALKQSLIWVEQIETLQRLPTNDQLDSYVRINLFTEYLTQETDVEMIPEIELELKNVGLCLPF